MIKILKVLQRIGLALLITFSAALVFHAALAFPIKSHQETNRKALERALTQTENAPDAKTTSEWLKQLNRASLYQDILHFFCSKPHFDNCCFEEGIRQINKLKSEIEGENTKLEKATKESTRRKIRLKMFFKTGRLVHSAQDFFSHSSFVEMMQSEYDSIEKVPVLNFWSSSGQETIRELMTKGLVSQKFPLSFPHKCTSEQRIPLAKDTAKTKAGKLFTIWKEPQTKQALTAYEAARHFAEHSTYEILVSVFGQFPGMTTAKLKDEDSKLKKKP